MGPRGLPRFIPYVAPAARCSHPDGAGSDDCGRTVRAECFGPLPETNTTAYAARRPNSGPITAATCGVTPRGYTRDAGRDRTARRALAPTLGWTLMSAMTWSGWEM